MNQIWEFLWDFLESIFEDHGMIFYKVEFLNWPYLTDFTQTEYQSFIIQEISEEAKLNSAGLVK